MPVLSPVPLLASVRVLPPKGLNTSGYLNLNRIAEQTAWAHGFMHVYALWLGPVLLVAVFIATYALAWWHRATRAAALLLLGGVGTIVALGLNQLVGHAAGELRPYATYHRALVLVAKTNDYSFPSDHSVVAGGLTLTLLLALGAGAWRRREDATRDPTATLDSDARIPRSLRALAGVNIVLGLFFCFARVYVGAHYPGDVVAGYLLASVVVGAISLLRPVVYRVIDLTEPTIVGALLRRPAGAFTGGTSKGDPVPETDG